MKTHIVAIYLQHGIFAKPRHKSMDCSNEANDFDLQGNVCPINLLEVECPPICVNSIEQCPDEIKPTCSDGKYYCADGECHSGPSPEFACAHVDSM